MERPADGLAQARRSPQGSLTVDVRLVSPKEIQRHDTPLLVVPVRDDEGKAAAELPPGLGAALDHVRDDLRGRVGHVVVVNTGASKGPRRIAFVGVGSASSWDAEAVRRFAGRAVRAAEARELTSLSLYLLPGELDAAAAVQAATEGLVLAAWRFTELKSSREEDGAPVTQVSAAEIVIDDAHKPGATEGIRVGRAVATGQNFARSLQDRPGNLATPEHLGDEAEAMAREVGLEVEVFDLARIKKERMHALLAVNQGSDIEPRFIVLRHRGGKAKQPFVALVGKGLTFDAGGISIKPAQGMEDMKYDMSGGAAVMGAMRAIAEIGLPLNVVGLIPSTENLINGKAVRPGDIIQTRGGKTVEVINTDAEGRLILADALDYAKELGAAAIVDMATLTGSVVIALGAHAIAVLGTDDALIQQVRDAGQRAGERCWPLPLWPEYKKQLKSEAADMMNVGGRPAGTITAAWFLREFVGDVPWAHLDIAGTAYGTEPLPYQRKGGYGVPTRLLVEWLRGRLA
ncbi:MAG: leucyl aminopeptidase [Gemmatimonadetes bacterium]|nr:leucyl aminopeptidase [Gemmatimonadota bacterium]